MKRIFTAAIALLLTICISVNVFAELPAVSVSEKENIEFGWLNKTIYNTLPTDAKFYINYKILTEGVKNYKVVVECSDGQKIVFNEKIEPSKQVRKTYTLDLKKGGFDFSLKIFDGDRLVKEFTDKIAVMTPYTYQFMQEIMERGVNTPTGSLTSRTTEAIDRELGALMGMGLFSLRGTDDAWSYFEYAKGAYTSQPSRDIEYGSKSARLGIRNGSGAGWSAATVPPEDGVTFEDMTTGARNNIVTFPKTPESLKAFADYAIFRGEYRESIYGENYIGIQVANEPNLNGFNESIVMPNMDKRQMTATYADAIKSLAVQLQKRGYDRWPIRGLELAAMQDDFTQLCFEYGAYPLMDKFAYHPYPEKEGFIPPYTKGTNKFYIATDFFENEVIKFGGWKQIDLTETGFTTIEAKNAVTEQEAAEGLVKIYTYADLVHGGMVCAYNMVNNTPNRTDRESNWGMFDYNYNPKKTVPAITQLNTKTNGATLLGSIDFGIEEMGTECLVYNKDGKPVIVGWTDRQEGFETVFEGESVKVEDLYGNLISEGDEKVTLQIAPIYIENVDEKYFADATYNTVAEHNAEWLGKYADRLADEDLEAIKNIFKEIENIYEELPSEQEALSAIEKYDSAGKRIIALGEKNKLSNLEVSQMLYEIYEPLEFAVNLYVAVYDGKQPKATKSYDSSYNRAKKLYKDDIKVMQYSDGILEFAKKYDREVGIIEGLGENPTKAGVVAGWNKMIDILCGWFNGFSAYEQVINIGLQIQIPHYRKVAYSNSFFEMDMNLTNYSNESFTGTIICYDENGVKVAETKKFTLPANCVTKTIPISWQRSGDTEQGYSRYVLKYIDTKGTEVASQICDIKVQDKIQISIEPVSDSVESLKVLTGKITNLTDEDWEIVIKMNGDDNLLFDDGQKVVVVPANKSVKVDFPIVDIKDIPFHEYSYNYEAYDNTGSLIAKKTGMLSFTVVAATKNAVNITEVDESKQGWENAYPLFLSEPNNPLNEEEWQNSTLSAKVYTMWDESNFYTMVDLNDDRHLQEYFGADMWQGDCVQIVFDPLNDKKVGGYAEDDYEFGFTLTPNGNEFAAWTGEGSFPSGVVDFFNVKRDDTNKKTLYMIKLNKNLISNMKFEKGHIFGMNFVLNDADILGRDRWVEFTEGTAMGKNPSKLANFKLID